MTYKDKGSYESSPPCTFPCMKCLFVRKVAREHRCCNISCSTAATYMESLFVRYLFIYKGSLREVPFHIRSVYLWDMLWVTFPFSKCLFVKSLTIHKVCICEVRREASSHIWSDHFLRFLSICEESMWEVRCEVPFHLRRAYLWGTFSYTKCLFVRYVVRYLSIYEESIFWGTFPYAKCLFWRYVVRYVVSIFPYMKSLLVRYLSIYEECICEVPFHMWRVYLWGTFPYMKSVLVR